MPTISTARTGSLFASRRFMDEPKTRVSLRYYDARHHYTPQAAHRRGTHRMNNDAHASSKATVLLVDDTPENLALMSGLLRPHYAVKIAPAGERALQIAFGDSAPDLILLDIMMP